MWHSSPCPKYSCTSSGHWLASAGSTLFWRRHRLGSETLDDCVRHPEGSRCWCPATRKDRNGVEAETIDARIQPALHPSTTPIVRNLTVRTLIRTAGHSGIALLARTQFRIGSRRAGEKRWLDCGRRWFRLRRHSLSCSARPNTRTSGDARNHQSVSEPSSMPTQEQGAAGGSQPMARDVQEIISGKG